MEDAKIPGNFTNHSLRATGTTTLFDAGVPEALIQKRSGHRSSKALRVYERVTPEQNLAVSKTYIVKLKFPIKKQRQHHLLSNSILIILMLMKILNFLNYFSVNSIVLRTA